MTLEQALRAIAEAPNTHLAAAARLVVAEMERRSPERADEAERQSQVWKAHAEEWERIARDAQSRCSSASDRWLAAAQEAQQLRVQLAAQVRARDDMAEELADNEADCLELRRLRGLERAARELLKEAGPFVRRASLRAALLPHLRVP